MKTPAHFVEGTLSQYFRKACRTLPKKGKYLFDTLILVVNSGPFRRGTPLQAHAHFDNMFYDLIACA